MTRALLIALAVALALSPGAAAAPRPIVRPADEASKSGVALGSELYAGDCATCHGINGRGTPIGPPLRGVGALAPDFYLSTGYMPLGTAREQPQRVRVLLSKRERDAITSYIASLGNGPAIPTPDPASGDLAEGRELFTEHCAGCHQVVAEGGYVTGAVAPPLEDATPVQIAEAVRIGPYLMPRFSKKQISDAQLNSIVRYVQYAKHPHDPGGWAIGHVGPVPEGLVTWFIGIAAVVATCLVIGRRLSS
jgi:ubiquinol-cytochrome c reductase cytochrome c subunit